MIKKLLSLAAIAAVAFNMNADKKVLWQAEEPDGDPIEGWNTFYEMTAEECAIFNDYDIIYMTITAKGESGWPQVALFELGKGWPPFNNSGAGDVPNSATMTLTPDDVELIKETGISFRGESVYVSEIGYEPLPFKVDPNAVFIGPKECNWGNAAEAKAEVFADVKPGDRIIVEYDPAFKGMNVNLLFGGWSGCPINIGRFGDVKFVTLDSEKATITIDLTYGAEDFKNWANDPEKEEAKDWNLLTQLKEGGFLVQGPSVINQILYIKDAFVPVPETPDDPTTGVETISSVESSVLYNVFGQPVDDNYRGIVIKNGKKIMKK